MSVLLGTVFLASLLGSLHCVGMCGPFALLASTDPQRRAAAMGPTLAYSLGRLLTYSIIGLIFGALGMAINGVVTSDLSTSSGPIHGASINQWQQTATYVAGGLMILVGVIALARHFGVRITLPTIATPVQRFLQSAFQRTIRLAPLPRAITIGMLTSLMPCGWLYTFAISAAGTGAPVSGMLLMITFWAGTVPIMTALTLGVSHISNRVQQQIPLMMSVLVLLIGVFTIASRAPVDLTGMSQNAQVVSGAQALADQINSVDHAELPCCQCEEEPE
jgi:sulfite exporter TauE/SafE